MLLTPHTLVGVVIGAVIPSPIIAVPLAFLSHFLGDLVPHYDPYKEFPTKEQMGSGWQPVFIIGDIALGVALGVFFTLHALWLNHNPQLAMNIFLCGIAAVAPDMAHAPILYWNSQNKLIRLIYKIQTLFHNKAGPIWGNITQFSIAAVAFLMILNLLSQ